MVGYGGTLWKQLIYSIQYTSVIFQDRAIGNFANVDEEFGQRLRESISRIKGKAASTQPRASL